MRILALGFLAVLAVHAATIETKPVPSFFFYEENTGQADADVRLLVRGGPHRTYFTARSINLFNAQLAQRATVRFAAASSNPAIRRVEAWSGTVNRFEGASQSWRRNIPAHRRAQFTGIYPGVDLIVGESNGEPTFTYVVTPGADLTPVVLDAGETSAGVEAQGDWRVAFAFGGWTFRRPRAYQEAAGGRTNVTISYTGLPNNQVRFQTGGYDRSRTLTIEVDLLSGQAGPLFTAPMAMDASGNAFIAGSIASPTTCSVTPGATINFCADAFAAGFDPQSRPLFFSVFAGRTDDGAAAVALDGEGRLVVAGNTDSSDFPVTANAHQSANAGPLGPKPRNAVGIWGDLFLVRLNPSNGDLLYSTFFGGPTGETPLELVTLGRTDAAVLVTAGKDFPTTSGAWITQACDGCFPSALLKFDVAGGRLLFATFMPATARAIAAQTDGSLFIAGATEADIPVTPEALQGVRSGTDAYIVRLAANGSSPVFATYYGGDSGDGAFGIVAGNDGEAWVFGNSISAAGRGSSFLIRLSPDGSRLLGEEKFSFLTTGRLLRNVAGQVVLYGTAESPSLAATSNAFLGGGCGDFEGHAYVRLYRADGSGDFASYLPGSRAFARSAAMEPSGALQWISTGRVERLVPDAPSSMRVGCLANAANRWNYTRVAPGEIVTLIGTRMGPDNGVVARTLNGRYPSDLEGVRVLIGGAAAPLLYVRADQINAVAPSGLTAGAKVEAVVEFRGQRSPPLMLDVAPSGFAIFSMSGSGLGQAAALNEDGSINSVDNPARRGSFVVLYGTGAGVTIPPSPDGALAPLSDIPRLAAPVRVLVGGAFSVTPAYAGPAPGQVNGLVQINVRLPDDLPADWRFLSFDVVVGETRFVSPVTAAVRP